MALRERHLGLGFESTYGTAVTPTLFLPTVREALRFEPLFDENHEIRSPHLQSKPMLGGVVRGNAEVKLNFQDVAHLFYAILGSVDTVGAGPDYTHTSPGSGGVAVRPSLTAQVVRDDPTSHTWIYGGVILTGLAARIAPDSVAMATLDFVGKSEDTATGASGTEAYGPLADLMLPKQATVKIDGTTVTAMEVNLNIVRAVDEVVPIRGSGSFAVQPTDAGPIQVAGDFVVREEAALTDYAKFVAGTDVDIQVEFTTADEEALTINMNKCRINQATPGLDGPNVRQATYEFTSLFDTVATGDLQAITTNNESAVP